MPLTLTTFTNACHSWLAGGRAGVTSTWLLHATLIYMRMTDLRTLSCMHAWASLFLLRSCNCT